jgi:ribosomal protein S18 acetylase RimI-like enzyme
MAATGEVNFRTATSADLPAVGRVYLRAFRSTLEEIHAPQLSEQAMADVMSACLLGETGSVIVAETSGQSEVIGYITAMAEAGGLWRALLGRGLMLLWLARWATGRYRLPVGAALGLLRETLSLWAVRRRLATTGGARVFSLAVLPEWQGRGVGARLLDLAIERIRALESRSINLEVRADNAPARRLYQRVGFRRTGEFRDTRGVWEAMTLDLGKAEAHGA